MSEIKDMVVAITGASIGIGEATALLFAERGAKVVLGARGTERLAALADRIAGAGGDATYASTDVKRRHDLAALVALARERYGKLDVLVNNAGSHRFDDLRVEDWDEMIDLNIKGVLYGIAAALPVFSQPRFRPRHQHRLYRRLQDGAESGRVFGDEVRRSRALRRVAARSG